MSRRGYMPRSDSGALRWMLNFAGTLAADPARYGVSPEVAETVRQVVAAYEAAYRLAVSPATRTPPNILAKDCARGVAEATCRVPYMLIKHNMGVTDGDKVALGVTPPGSGGGKGMPIGAPTTSPALSLVGMTRGRQVLTVRDAMWPGRRAKPEGAASLQLYRALGEDRASGPGEAAFYKAYTRDVVVVEFEHAANRKVATYFARWASAKGEVGPWSAGVSMTVAA